MQKFDPWAEQDAYDKAIEKGAVYTCPRTGWKFRVRYYAPWSSYPRKAAAIVWSRTEAADLHKKVTAGETLTADEQATYDRLTLETAIRGGMISWSGVAGPDGKKLDANIENMLFVFGRLRRLWSDIGDFMTKESNFGLSAPQSAKAVPGGVNAEGNSSATSDSQPEDSQDS